MHIILYVLDALRADHLGCYGYERDTSPYIDVIAEDGVVFENCFTSTTWTRPAAASIITGAYPGVHLTHSRFDVLSVELPRMPEFLQAKGYTTAAFVTMGNIASEFGFDQGFDNYFELFREPKILENRRKVKGSNEVFLEDFDSEIALPLAEDINEFLFTWLYEHKLENSFSFVWAIDTHEPYNPPYGFRRFSTSLPTKPDEGETSDIRSAGAEDQQRLIDLYDDELIYNDHCLGEMVAFLKEKKLYDDTMLIILGDHGEAFYEHGIYSHGHAPFEEIIHVPLIIKFPQRKYVGKRVAGLVELIDIFPTVVATVEEPTNESESLTMQGYDLLPLIDGRADQVRDYAFSETRTLAIHNRYLSVRGMHWKYIRVEKPSRNTGTILKTLQHVFKQKIVSAILRSPGHFVKNYFARSNEWLFDLENDLEEQNNLIYKEQEKADLLRKALDEWLRQNDIVSKKIDNASVQIEESLILQKHLEKLGYL